MDTESLKINSLHFSYKKRNEYEYETITEIVLCLDTLLSTEYEIQKLTKITASTCLLYDSFVVRATNGIFLL